MAKPRYDEQKDETYHAAVDEKCCEDMSEKYGWKLKRIKDTNDSLLPKDCIFDGYCEFPPSPMDLSQGDYFKERKEDA
ncbi:MAG TPA: hypothetical protein DDW51_00645 [Cyanobacteria bacterium UBA11367]|nr:hypothetical protein [Cyanobacteria bacterium UBA11367]HBK65976.1 hypothetical protein [Cyanobacteria bacterium UBA11166]HCA95432.1 hypothetical protein [Cyanobacteria bacterium UBA9226]